MDIVIPAWIDGQLQPVEKLQTHLRGLKHKAVSVFVMRGAETLLQRRAMSKYHTPGLWANACCTHPEWGETGFDCAQRRLEEELGLAGQVPVCRGTVEYRADVGGGARSFFSKIDLASSSVQILLLESRYKRGEPRQTPGRASRMTMAPFGPS